MHKLLQINNALGRGSTGRIAETIGELASKRGWECYMAHGPRYAGVSSFPSYRAGDKCDSYLHYAKSVLFDAHGLGSTKVTRKLVRWIKALSPDVVHLHNIHGYWLNYAVLFEFLNKADIPVVWTLHDCWPLTGHCAMFTSEICHKFESECKDCPHLDWYPKSLFIDRSDSNFNRKRVLFSSCPNLNVVSVSNWLDGLVGKSFLKDTRRMVIPNGVDTDVFFPRVDAINGTREKFGIKDKIVVLSVADKWHEGIGFSDFPLLRERLDDRFVIVLVGVTQKQKEALPEGIIGVTHTDSRQELAELYTMADITLMPQTVATFGLVCVESMACGTPALVYAPAAAEVIRDNGYSVPPRDIAALAGTLYRFAEDGGKERFSESCIKNVHEFYDEKKNYGRYVDLYDSLIR